MILNNAARFSTLSDSCTRRNAQVQSLLAQIKKQRQAKRDSHGENRNNDQPAMSDSETLALDARERKKHHGRDQNVHAEERANAIGEEFANEERKIQSVLECPGNKFRIREDEAQDAERKVQGFGLHPGILSDEQVAQSNRR